MESLSKITNGRCPKCGFLKFYTVTETHTEYMFKNGEFQEHNYPTTDTDEIVYKCLKCNTEFEADGSLLN